MANGMMRISDTLEAGAMKVVDRIFSLVPQRTPPLELLHSCKIIAHRGDHDNLHVMENTLPAFDRAMEGGVWGVEFDLRWTRDHHPVVYHDADLMRLHGKPVHPTDLSMAELRRNFPMIPALEEVLERYGRKMHLMIEIKKEPDSAMHHRKNVLCRILSTLNPVEDFHVLSLDPEVFSLVDFLPPRAWVAVGTVHLKTMSDFALKNKLGGIAGHYLLLSDSMLRKHRGSGQKLGTGYACSRNVLYREINRGVDWIFSNNAVFAQSFCSQLPTNDRTLPWTA